MSFEITTAFVKQFEDNITLLAQQRGSKLRGLLAETPLTGKSVFMDQIGATQAMRTTTRHADSPLISTPHKRRRISSIDVEWGDLIDDFDKLKMIVDPESSVSLNAAWAIGREMDDIVFEKFFATAFAGEEGNEQVSFPASNTVAAGLAADGTTGGGSVTGLNVPKLRAARRKLLENEVDLDAETPHIVVTAKALDDLLGQTEVTSADFNTVRTLVNGDIDTYMGFRFVRSERVPTAASGDLRLPIWVPSGMGLAVSQNPTARITERADKRFSTYVYYSMSVGASRLEEEKVIEVPVAP